MNICYLVRSFGARAGTESYVDHMARALARQGHQVHIVSTTGHDRSLFQELKGQIVFHEITEKKSSPGRVLGLERLYPMSVASYGKTIARVLPALVEDQAIDIVEATDWGMDAWAYLPERQVPVCVRLHGYPGFKDEFDRRLLKAWPRNYFNWKRQRKHILSADLVTGVSQAYLDFVREAWETGEREVKVIPIAIDPSLFHPGEGARAARSVLFVGRLEASKGMGTLAKAIPEILKAIPEAVFHFAGTDHLQEGEKRTWSQYLISEYGEKRMVYLGSIQTPELLRHYQTATLCVVPSLYEPGGTVAFEAMACGCPVLASRVGGLGEVIQDGRTGGLVPPGDAAALAQGVIALLLDEALREQYGQNALALVREKFDLDTVARRTVEAYAEAIRTFKVPLRRRP